MERATFRDFVESEDRFVTSSDTQPNANLFQTLQFEFLEVFDPSHLSCIVKHSIIASVETVTKILVTIYSRRLSPKKFRRLKIDERIT